MKSIRRTAWGVVLLLTCAIPVWSQQNATGAGSPASGSTSQLPRLVRFSGTLKDVNGNPLTGIIGVTFSLYAEQSGGVPLWLETQNVQLAKNGHYTVQLGSTKPDGLPVDLFTSEQAQWLGVQAQGQAEQVRVLLLSVPYALKAGDAETVGGLPPSAFVLAAPSSSSANGESSAASLSGSLSGAPPPAGSVTRAGTIDFVPLWTSSSNIGNSVLFQSGTGSTAKIGINTNTPGATLDVKGGTNIEGLLTLPATGTATASAGKNSQSQNFVASSYNSSTATAVSQTFQWRAEPLGNDTTTPSGALSLLFGSGTAFPAETGLKLSSKGLFTFATGQTFPNTGTLTGVTTATSSGLTGGGTKGTVNLSLKTCAANQVLQYVSGAWTCSNAGAGTITGVTAGTDLTGGGTGGTVTLNVDTSKVPQLGTANTFTGNQTISGNLTDTGNISASGSITGQTGSFSGNNSSQIMNVTQSGGGNGVSATSTSGVGLSGVGIYGVEGQTSTADAPAILGVASGTSGEGVFGQETATTGTNYGVYGQNASPGGAGVEGYATSSQGVGVLGTAPNGAGVGVEGTSNGAGGIGVYGQETATTGTNWGVIGSNGNSASGGGVLGYSLPTSGSGIGISGVSFSPGGAGVLGQAPGSTLSGTGTSFVGTTAFGTWGDTSSNDAFATGISGTADDAIGVLAMNNGVNLPALYAWNNTATFNQGGEVLFAAMPNVLGNAYAILGDAGCATGFMGLQLGQQGMQNCTNYTLLGDNSGNTYVNAVSGQHIYFRLGNTDEMDVDPTEVTIGQELFVAGNLLVGGNKNFRIDDPLDPANKYLFHAAIESSEVLNLYSGNIVLDASGEAIIQLPAWFEVVNKDFRYQLTSIGAPGRDLYIAEEVSGGHFKIAGGTSGGKVSWQVSGVRNDAWEKEHPMVVEADKGANRGRYLTPQFYGAPESSRIGYVAPLPVSEQIVQHRRPMPRRTNTTQPSTRTPPMVVPTRPTPLALHSVSPAAPGTKSQLNQR